MSITFWMPDAPTERVQPYPDEPDYWENQPVAPFMEINMSNSNALAILQLISPQDAGEYNGVWGLSDLARVRATTIKALNTSIKNRAVTATEVSGGPGTGQCRFVSFGRDEDYVAMRLEQFLALTKVAMDHGFNVSWG